ncbi:DNA-directed RNA polymerase, subunit 2 like protein, partial [Aduncisulcus paluster]
KGIFKQEKKTSKKKEKKGADSSLDKKMAVDQVGAELVKQGMNYYGNEVMYSGIYGTEMPCEIFFGSVYNQRLRHMVSDKYQVRAKGKINEITRQPIKGRKRGGGIRVGEMERYALIAHGAT